MKAVVLVGLDDADVAPSIDWNVAMQRQAAIDRAASRTD